MAASTRERDSAGRLLRAVRDSELSHMELAIAAVDAHAPPGGPAERKAAVGRSTRNAGVNASLEKTADGGIRVREGGSDANATGQSAKGRVLALSDHKRIANLQSVLDTLVKAYAAQDDDSQRNLVYTVAGAAITQTMRDCTASRSNPCIWGPQAQKLHMLLYWMIKRESVATAATPASTEVSASRDFVRDELLEWLQPAVDKQKQLAATLTLFEMLQVHRRSMQSLGSGNRSLSLLGLRSDAVLNALLGLVNRGSIRMADSTRVKPSKLALIAVETLVLLCGDIAAQFMTSSAEDRLQVASSGELREMVEAMETGLQMLRQWHLHSTRRQFFVYALEHLQSYASVCGRLLTAKSDGDIKAQETTAMLDALCWHWQATAPLLCTRSDAVIRVRKNRPTEMLGNTLRLWASRALTANAWSPQSSPGSSSEQQYAQVRYVCILMSLIGGAKELSRSFDSFGAEGKAYFLVLLVQGLSSATRERNDPATLMVAKIFRSVLLDTETLELLASMEEKQALLSQLLRCIQHYYAGFETPSGTPAPRGQTQLELFAADFIIQRELSVAELQVQLTECRDGRVQGAASLVRTLLYRLDREVNDTPLHRLWRRQLTSPVLGLLGDERYPVRRLTLSCLPSLDPVHCVRGLCAMDETLVDKCIVVSALGFLFSTSTGSLLEAMADVFIDACRFGCGKKTQESGDGPASSHWWHNQAAPQDTDVTGGESDAKASQERLLTLCFGNNGWSKRVNSPEAHATVLRSVLHKIFGSPRDTVLLRILREFVAAEWVTGDVSELVVRMLVGHMSTQPRLSEAFLDDDSPSSAQRVEALLFARLAPMLVLRVLPRSCFRSICVDTLLCGREDLAHLEKYTEEQLQLQEVIEGGKERGPKADATGRRLFHLLARSIVDPLEFKEVKMLAAENLAKFPPALVLPFILAHLIAFLREEQPLLRERQGPRQGPFAVCKEDIPSSCGLVSAKLMVYYLNRVLAEDGCAYKDVDMVSAVLTSLVQILAIPYTQDSSAAADQTLLTDLQRGCIDCISLLLSKLSAEGDSEIGSERTKGKATQTQEIASSLMHLLLGWIFRESPDAGEGQEASEGEATLGSRTQLLLERVWSNIQQDGMPLQVRICCCNVLLSALSRSDNDVLAHWKAQGVIAYIAAATARCAEEDIVAGGLQILFSFIYKAGESLSMERENDLQFARDCYEVTLSLLESTCSEKVAMSGLKVVGALIGKLPTFVGTLPPVELERLINGCLVSLRDRRVSVVVSELAQSLLHVLTAS